MVEQHTTTLRAPFVKHGKVTDAARMRVYDCSHPGAPVVLKSLMPSGQEPDLCEYIDVVEDVGGQLARVYLFWRDAI